MSVRPDADSLDHLGRKQDGIRGLLIVTLLPIIWGTTFPVVKFALIDASPMAFSVIRFGGTTVGFLLLSKFARKGFRILLFPENSKERRVLLDAVVLGGALGAGYMLQVYGLMSTSASKSAFLTSTAVIWTPILSFLVGREKFTWKLFAAITITLVGILLLTHPYRDNTGFVLGDLLTLGCALSFSTYIIWVDKALPNALAVLGPAPAHPQVSASVIVTSNQLVISTVMMSFGLPFEHIRFTPTPGPLGGAIYTAVFATALTAFLQARYQHAVSPSTASIIYMLEPVVAAMIGYFFLTERLGTEETLGALLIVLGVFVAQLRFSRKIAPPQSATI